MRHHGVVLTFVLGLILVGLIVGALGRLVVRGRNPIGLLATICCGIGGSVIGGGIARALMHNPNQHRLITIVLEVLVAAIFVSLLSQRRGRRRLV
jgi:uncharacterized membrane protein YeaQ/YmgE (transglycosylase-associated protein family)